ncbi:MAG TPA: hypothetical protein VGR08_02915 [Thermomicrobiales bacterium]|nr:hypothetical protein [Thermomicrobiales bacterium]
MTEHDQGASDLSTGERMATLAGAATDAIRHKARGEQETESGTRQTVDLATAQQLIAGWPDAPQRGARQMLEQYGPPNEATPTKLFWYRAGPWKRIIATRDVVTHNFPAPHSDFLTQYIDYRVPIDKFDEIARFDGSCLVDRTSGEAGARCDSEAANTITLNLMHDIVTGKTTVDEARQTFGEVMVAYTMGRSAPYAEGLQFAVPDGGTGDEDDRVIGGETLGRQAAGKVADLLTGDEAPSDG